MMIVSVVILSEYDRANQFLRMVLEVGETDLSSFLRARGAGLPPALVLHYWEEMLHAVRYIHEHGALTYYIS
jgi:serine/threonine protein kinase